MSGTGPHSGPAGATAPARRKARKPSERSERPAPEGYEQDHPAARGVWGVSGTGPRSGPAGATAPVRRRRESQASGASARRLRDMKKNYRAATPTDYSTRFQVCVLQMNHTQPLTLSVFASTSSISES